MDIIPKSDNRNIIAEEALKNLSKEYTSKINILFSNHDSKQNKEAGLYFEYLIKDQDLTTQFIIEQDQELLIGLISKYNYHLLSDKARQYLQNEQYEKVIQNSMSLLYSPFKAGLLPFNNDPFLLMPDFMMNLGLIKSSFLPQDGVLTVKLDNQTYAYMLVSINQDKMFSPTYLLPLIKKINQAKEKTLLQYPDTQINISGVPMHSYKATSNSINEINFITIVSIIFILFVSYLMFRSINCFLYAVFTIGVSFGFAFCITTAIFAEIHVLVLLFGASLIGLCIDYHIHYFVERAYTKNVLPKIQKAINISITTSVTGFAIMMLSGVSLILHMGVFAIVGLVNAYLIINMLYPIMLQSSKVAETPQYVIAFEKKLTTAIYNIFKNHFYIKVAALTLIFGSGIIIAQPSDSIKDLYKPDSQLLKAEILFGKVTNMGSSPVMMISTGSNDQEVFEKEEQTREFLESQILSKNISGYKSLTQIVPSIKRQNENYDLIKKLFASELKYYLRDLKISHVYSIDENLKFQKDNFISISDLWNYKIFDSLKGFYIEEGTNSASIILIENAHDKQILKAYADSRNLIFSDKIEELSDILKHTRLNASLSVIMIIIFMYVLLSIAYKSIKNGFALIAPSLLSIIITLGIFGFAGINISLFHILALFLILCCGVDYAVFRVETKDKVDNEGVAVMLAWITTLASFGALAFTSFAVTNALGTTLCIGLTLSYILSPIAIKTKY